MKAINENQMNLIMMKKDQLEEEQEEEIREMTTNQVF
jgi:hypothetical protein